MGKDEEIEALKRKRAVAKGKFTRKANLFTTAHGDEAPVTVLQGICEEIELAFKKVEDISDELNELLNQCEENNLTEEAGQHVSELESRKINFKIDLEKAKSVQQNQIKGSKGFPPTLKMIMRD